MQGRQVLRMNSFEGNLTPRHPAGGSVGLFYIISGFVVSLGYSASAAVRFSAGDFWMRRVGRLGPTSVLTGALGFFFKLFAHPASTPDLTILDLVLCFTGMTSWVPSTNWEE